MYLQTDEQTIQDLGIFGKDQSGGIFALYNLAHTRGGEEALKNLFQNPLANRDIINRRSNIIAHFSELNIAYPFTGSLFDRAEKYLANKESKQAGPAAATLNAKEMQTGVSAIIEILWTIKDFLELPVIISFSAYQPECAEIMGLLADPVFEPVLRERPSARQHYSAITAFDSLFRLRAKEKIKSLLKYLYLLDVYIAVAKVAIKRDFVFAKALGTGEGELGLDDVYHPELKSPIANTVAMSPEHNLIFLTGANMAGKSTFLRAVSTALYIAHMGFPVAAKSMVFSVMDGMYTTINLPDKLGIGASHFYVEVLRVKKIAGELNKGKSLFIIFDEMFRGTNVKDAQEATVAISSAFTQKNNSLFIISSHIVEAAELLKQKSSIVFQYLPTLMNGTVPEYSYTLKEGVTDDRHGMIIIRNEGILDLLKKGLQKKSKDTPHHTLR